MDRFPNYLKKSAKKVDLQLNTLLEQAKKEAVEISPKLVPLVEVFADSCKGGKRVRGMLVMLGYEITNSEFKVQNSELEITKVAAVYEIFQTAILSHDDVIDQSPLRRGKPTIYRRLGGDHYAISQTITIGDIGFFLAMKILAETNFPALRKNKAIEFFSKSMLKTGLGQSLDIELSRPGKKDEEDALKISLYKTAWYTIIGPMSVGAILGGASKKQLDGILEFGKNLGIAFQIQDDILGVFGQEEDLGKSINSDIEEGKNTLLLTQALKRANKQQVEYLEKHYGQGVISQEEFMKIREIFESSGALDYVSSKAVEYARKAKGATSEITDDEDCLHLLNKLADFLINRRK